MMGVIFQSCMGLHLLLPLSEKELKVDSNA